MRNAEAVLRAVRDLPVSGRGAHRVPAGRPVGSGGEQWPQARGRCACARIPISLCGLHAKSLLEPIVVGPWEGRGDRGCHPAGGGSCRGLRRAQAVSSPTPHAEGCRATVCRPSSAGGAGPDTPASGSGQRQPRSQGRLSRDGRPSCGSHRLLRPGLLRSSLKGSWSGSVGRWSAGAATPRRPGRRPRSSSRRRRAWRPDVREPRGADRRGVWCGLWRARRRS